MSATLTESAHPAHVDAALAAAARALSRVQVCGSDDELLRLASDLEGLGRSLDSLRASVATEIARRSDRALGHDGLAARRGFRTPGALISSVTLVSGRVADRRVRVGERAAPLGLDDPALSIGIDATEAIGAALGPLVGFAPQAELDASVAALVNFARYAPADVVSRSARLERDRLDVLGIDRRERELRSKRYLRFGRAIDGLVPFSGMLPIEEAGVVKALFDSRTSARRAVARGPHNDAPESGSSSAPVDLDHRTMDQRRLDTLVEICRIAAGTLTHAAGESAISRGAGTIVVTIPYDQLASEIGSGRIDGHDEPLSAATVRRVACNAAILPIVLGADSQPLDLGFSRRLFSAGQRRALALRDKGCAVETCDAPPGWTEAHHIVPWSHHGPTDLRNGVLLCSFHHHQAHAGRLDITVRNGRAIVTRTSPTASGREHSSVA
jgi:hypothetical protein